MGDTHLIGWVVLKSDVSLNDELNEPLAKLCAITQTDYWERLVNIDGRSRIFILQITMVIVLKRIVMFLFTLLRRKSDINFMLQ